MRKPSVTRRMIATGPTLQDLPKSWEVRKEKVMTDWITGDYSDVEHRASTSIATGGGGESLTLQKILDAMASIPEEPIGKWMREQGYPPPEWILFLPADLKQDHAPDYVRFSPLVTQPMALRRNLEETFYRQEFLKYWQTLVRS